MDSLRIIKPGLYSSIQDLGRTACTHLAIPTGGVLHKSHYLLGQSILNNEVPLPTIECLMIAPTIQFDCSLMICLTGSDFRWLLNDQPVNRNTAFRIMQGDVLKGSAAKTGWVGYIAFDRDIITTRHFDSASTYSLAALGGNEGKTLQKLDAIRFDETPQGRAFNQLSNIENASSNLISLQSGPDYNILATPIRSKLNSVYKISTQSNRMGIRLSTSLDLTNPYKLNHSVPVWPGIVQLTPSGELIVVMQDGQTTGGYPRIGYIDDAGRESILDAGLGKDVSIVLEN